MAHVKDYSVLKISLRHHNGTVERLQLGENARGDHYSDVSEVTRGHSHVTPKLGQGQVHHYLPSAQNPRLNVNQGEM